MKRYNIANLNDRHWTRNRYMFAFGAYGWTHVLVFANSLDDALDEAVNWLAENAPGLLCDEQVNEEYKRLVAEGMSEEAAQQQAETDMTCAGNCGNYIASWEWSVLENPSIEDLKKTG